MADKQDTNSPLEKTVVDLSKDPFRPKFIYRSPDDEHSCIRLSEKQWQEEIYQQVAEARNLLREAKIPYWDIGPSVDFRISYHEPIHVVLDFGSLQFLGIDNIKDFVESWKNKTLPCKMAFDFYNKKNQEYVYGESSKS